MFCAQITFLHETRGLPPPPLHSEITQRQVKACGFDVFFIYLLHVQLVEKTDFMTAKYAKYSIYRLRLCKVGQSTHCFSFCIFYNHNFLNISLGKFLSINDNP